MIKATESLTKESLNGRDPGNSSSKAHWFLKVSRDDSHTEVLGPVRWEQEHNPRGMSLDPSKTRIAVDDDGIYVVFVQAVFILRSGSTDTGQTDKRVRLRLQLNTNGTDGIPEDQLVAAWDEREVKDVHDEQIVHLSFMVLLELKKSQYIRVMAKHRDKLDYNTPLSTFLTIVKHSDLQD
ncbi:uncharacterized protein LOC116222817 isoform X2 [Clupea harengus]|uniref:Uncharacterized protein LOC116222817 isoform X2 n=1 Tax=Clupea harengus TaxID=7950 RepID=A0A6P8G2Z5_CLUHA|nr:uncharacterized protein LOC116222817 isoform X2 [Clupea harengus]